MEGKNCTIPKHAGSDVCLAWAFKGQCSVLASTNMSITLATPTVPSTRFWMGVGSRALRCDGPNRDPQRLVHRQPPTSPRYLSGQDLGRNPLVTVPARPSSLSASKPGSSNSKHVSSLLTLASDEPSPSTPPRRNPLTGPALAATPPSARQPPNRLESRNRPASLDLRQIALLSSPNNCTTTDYLVGALVRSWLVHCLRQGRLLGIFRQELPRPFLLI